ncbi:thioredoxin domain-containing protein [Stieleria sp. TO1_6]|uniref:vitamin K epoxide reductase family protein n=1 Tax=Stieleria tagensis TaxID=2956795 RepID=UPI00209A8FA2|nr:vitamin K epoxide reductase family protein [Stieleria tagensis]MCO8121295.1 thioredoxin domain-containing protein [Stieleria tagensis]
MSTSNLHHLTDSNWSLSRRGGMDADHGTAIATGNPTVNRAAWWAMLVCSTLALATSGYLAWASLTSSPVAGCGGGSVFDCGHVLHSRWSTVLSVPVSLPAMATHLTIISLLLFRPTSWRGNEWRWTGISFAALAAAAAAIWFIGLQVFWLQHLCPYCLVAHSCGIALAVMVLLTRPVTAPRLKGAAIAALVSVVGLVGLQSLNAAPQTFETIRYDSPPTQAGESGTEESMMFEAPEAATELFEAPAVPADFQTSQLWLETETLIAAIANPASLLLGQVTVGAQQTTADSGSADPAPQAAAPQTVRVLNNIKLQTDSWPIVGKPDAEMVFVELFDYTCPHCQRTHAAMESARQRMGDRLAVIMLPVPLDRKCNPTVTATHASHAEACSIAKLAVAVWAVQRDEFPSFHNWLFETKPSYSQALSKAMATVDGQKLQSMLNSNTPSDYISKHVALYKKAGAGTIPKLMFPSSTTVGAVESSDTLVRLIQQNLAAAN